MPVFLHNTMAWPICGCTTLAKKRKRTILVMHHVISKNLRPDFAAMHRCVKSRQSEVAFARGFAAESRFWFYASTAWFFFFVQGSMWALTSCWSRNLFVEVLQLTSTLSRAVKLFLGWSYPNSSSSLSFVFFVHQWLSLSWPHTQCWNSWLQTKKVWRRHLFQTKNIISLASDVLQRTPQVQEYFYCRQISISPKKVCTPICQRRHACHLRPSPLCVCDKKYS